jgi:N-acetylglucosaminyldiphosphoundecaprenol N-acetyl-beta-D-mannosaminyltransferase
MKPEPSFPCEEFLRLPLSDTGVDGLIQWLVEPDPTAVSPRVAAYLNAHTVNLALRQGSKLGPLFQQIDLLYPDGMSVVKAARRKGFPISERVSGADFFWRFCWAAAARKRRLVFVGGEEKILGEFTKVVSREIPHLKVVYSRNGYLPRESAERHKVIGEIKEKNPDIVLVGMGSPRQEEFALELRDAGIPTVWCVGALFEYFAPNYRAHAPAWMREHGLEWLFRLSQEPRRLAGRYLWGNLEFLWRCR